MLTGAIGAIILALAKLKWAILMKYSERESKQLEFKAKLPNFQSLVKTCVAFANGVGGKLIIGVEDKTREIKGIDDAIRDRIYDEFPNSLYDSTTPALIPEIYERNLSGINIIIIEIPNIIAKPVYVTKEGLSKGVYLRAGTSTRRATPEHIKELKKESRIFSFDEKMIKGDNVLNNALINETYSKISNKKLISEKIISHSSNTSNKKNYPTISGVLWFCDNPDNFIPEALVRCSRFEGETGRKILQTEEITGCLSHQIETSYKLIISWIKRDFELIGTKLKGNTLLPPEALREAIINALIHRKYDIAGAVKIALFDNRLEIFNPGNFPGLIDINNLGDGTTNLRNPNIARIARRNGYIETLGTGISLMMESCKKSGLQAPEFIENADSVKVIFNFSPALDISDSDEDKLIKYFKFYSQASISDIIKLLEVSRNTATRKLNKLVKAEKLIRKGKGPSVTYYKT